jgi:hypothetical protein
MSLNGKELELFESVEFCLALLGALPLPVFMIDDDNNCHTLSDLSVPSFEKLSSIVPDKGQNIWKLNMDEDESLIVKAVKKAREANERVSVKGKWKYKDSLLRNQMMVVAHAVPAEIGEKKYVIVAAEDTTELERLKGLLPICMQCNKIFNENTENWDKLENYISNKTTADFSHGICPDCSEIMVQQLEDTNWGKDIKNG